MIKFKWKYNITESIAKISNILKKNDTALETELETINTNIQTRKDAYSILTSEGESRSERMVTIEDKLSQLNDEVIEQAVDLSILDGKFNDEINNKTILNKSLDSITQSIYNPNLKIEPPIFSKFLSDLKKYVKTYFPNESNVNALISQCLDKTAKD